MEFRTQWEWINQLWKPVAPHSLKMLNTKQRRRVLVFFRYCTNFCLLPVRVDVQSWNVRPGTYTKRRARACNGSYALLIAHASYKAISLLHALSFCSNVPLHQLLFHGQVAWGGVIFSYWYFLQYVEHADLSAAFAEMTLAGNIATRGKILTPLPLSF